MKVNIKDDQKENKQGKNPLKHEAISVLERAGLCQHFSDNIIHLYFSLIATSGVSQAALLHCTLISNTWWNHRGKDKDKWRVLKKVFKGQPGVASSSCDCILLGRTQSFDPNLTAKVARTCNMPTFLGWGWTNGIRWTHSIISTTIHTLITL